MASFVCELSGQPLNTVGKDDTVVVTPSGHVCLKRLLLSKLADNGGVDPFATTSTTSHDSQPPLSEDQLVVLQTSSSSTIVPPRPHATSFPNILSLLQSEYDALVLELFDTRRLLESTRQELSQALYQNDAATRVLARILTERDAARQQLMEWQASSSGAAGPEPPVTTHPTPDENENATETGPPPTKKPKLADAESGRMAQEQLDILTSTWQTLSQQRKQQKKVIAERTVSIETLHSSLYAEESFHKAWHKARGKAGVLQMATVPGDNGPPQSVVTYGRDKQIVIYDVSSETVRHSIATNKVAKGGLSCLDANSSIVVAGDAKSATLHTFSMETGDPVQSLEVDGASGAVVQVAVHPSNQHVVANTSDGRVVLCAIDSSSNELFVLTTLQGKDNYTCGSLHPDGLLYAAGTSSGAIDLWDFKSQKLASTLSNPEASNELVSMAFSNNGYHLVVATSDEVMVWDLKKQKLLKTLTSGVGTIQSVLFDVTGKYLVQGGDGGVQVAMVKEWDTTARIGGDEHAVSELCWCEDNTIVVCSDKERQVRFYGVSRGE